MNAHPALAEEFEPALAEEFDPALIEEFEVALAEDLEPSSAESFEPAQAEEDVPAPVAEFVPTKAKQARYSALAEELASSRRIIETSFLDMGQRLLDSVGMLGEITAAHEGMPAELQGEDFTRAVSLLQMLREEAGALAERQNANGLRVDGMSVMARELNDPIDTLTKAVRNLGLIGINARIIAAGITEQSGDFAAFALDMIELGKDASNIVLAFSTSHRKLVAALTLASGANAQFREKHGDTLAIISARLGEQIAVVEQHKQHAIADVAESGRVAKKISARIGEAVSALQVGDMTRQRLEHVEDSLTDLDRQPTCGATEALVVRLQTLQLEETSADFAREVGSFIGAVGHLASDARLVLDDSRNQADALLAKGGTALAGLTDDLQAMLVLLADFETMHTRLVTLRAEVGECVADMQDRMEAIGSLEQTMRLLSINTDVRCSRLGEEGRALRVVAQEMRVLSALTVEAANVANAGLERSKTALNEDESPADAASHSLTADATTAIGLLNTVVARLRKRAATIATTGPRAAALLQDAAAASNAYGQHADEWQQLLEELDAACDQIDSEEGEPDLEFLARIRKRYTMAQERQIYDALCGGLSESVGAEPTPQEADADADLDSMLF
jgi:hypothetical protein